MVLSPTLTGLLQVNLHLCVLNSPFPKLAMCHEALWHTVTLQLHRFEHRLADRLINIRGRQTEVARHHGGSAQQIAELLICDTAFALRVGLDKNVEDKVVKGNMLVRSWIVDGALDETNILSLGVVLHMIEADIALRNMSDLAGNMVDGPPEDLVQTKLTASRAILCIYLVEDHCMVCKARAPIY